ncbi:hypothetical protein GCM10027059_34540 [Myceligenerans halotolerans]
MTSIPETTSDLERKSQEFAGEIGELIKNTIGVNRQIVAGELGDRFAVRPGGQNAAVRSIPLKVAGTHLADLSFTLFQTLDRSGEHLKTVRSDIAVLSTLDRTPLLRLEYLADMRKDPVAHWQVHAERGAFSHLLTMANANNSRLVRRPHDLSTVHLPVGGERFRPCLEDVLEMLIRDCGVDHVASWEDAIRDGRQRWRIRQLRAAVRDLQSEAAEVLRKEGWLVTAPEPVPTPDLGSFSRW